MDDNLFTSAFAFFSDVSSARSLNLSSGSAPWSLLAARILVSGILSSDWMMFDDESVDWTESLCDLAGLTLDGFRSMMSRYADMPGRPYRVPNFFGLC